MTIRDLVKEKGATVIDVRSSWEYADGHVDGAANIPLDEITQRVSEIQGMKAPYLLYCQSGNRSGMATSILQQSGVDQVFNGGGLADMRIALM
ncbi:MAG: rhodanese-like domain-containing protein [Bacteroidia bacterium]|jgi:phage shock protein E|nr:rhodanese-like domain-containing protein [Bacteroidia bacterium]